MLNLFENHFSYIRDFSLYFKTFVCSKCSECWPTKWHMLRHEKTCNALITHKFPGGVYRSTKSIFEELDDVDICVPENLRFYPFRSTFDYESFFSSDSLPNSSSKLAFTAKHEPCSVSLCSNVPGFQSPVCFVNDGCAEGLVRRKVEHLLTISRAAYEILKPKYQFVLDALDERGDRRSTNLKNKLDDFLKEHIVLGFNSGKYDINVVKVYLLKSLHPGITFTIKKNNDYMCIKTKELKFLDMKNYLAAGTSYDQFLKAYGVQVRKFFFPYEFLDSLEKLDYPSLPPHEAFYSSIKNSNISDEEYALCKRTWKEQKMTTLRDFLIYYNNLDTFPFLQAVEKAFSFFQDKKLDMFKSAISVPGLTLNYLFSLLTPDVYFTLISNQNRDLHSLFKENLVGGPSIVFHRYHEKDLTSLRTADFPEPKICKSIIGFDANALYLHAIMQDMPTGHFVRYQTEDGFKPRVSQKFGYLAFEWLEFVARQEGITIKHMFNGGEKTIGPRGLKVDGFCRERSLIFEFHGCIWHGCTCGVNRDAAGVLKKVNPFGKDIEQLREETKERTQHLRSLGYDVREMWECEWYRMRKDRDVQHIVKSLDLCKPKYNLNADAILEGVKNGSLFGVLLCDIETPDSLKEKFSEFCPIFKNTEVSREDISPLMRDFAEKTKCLPQPRKMLIGSYFAKKIFLITPLVKWYLEQGLVVTKVYEFVEYVPKQCFRGFGESVSEARRAGDRDPDKSVLANLMKLIGNSGYGKCITNLEKHKKVQYFNASEVSGAVNDSYFCDLDELDEDFFEVSFNKKSIEFKLPIQIGFFVYGYAKLRMLQFYHEFLSYYVDKKDFECLEMDTDSLYMALSGPSFEAVISPSKRREFYSNFHHWLPSQSCSRHRQQWIEKKCLSQDWTPDECCLEQQRYDKRTPGLFKTEWEGTAMVCLCSKTYFGKGSQPKQVCKGLNTKQNVFSLETYLNVIKNQASGFGTNKSFRVKDNSVYTYEQVRSGLSYFYPKRLVLDDAVSTKPLKI